MDVDTIWQMQDIIVLRPLVYDLSNKLADADPLLTPQDAYNEAFDYYCRRAGGHLVRALDVFMDSEDEFAHAYGWRVDETT
jgi:hypothetical protein